MSASILDGSLAAGSRLPSVREMAMELRINPNTVARAYREVEHAGLVTTEAGKGVFVAEPLTGDSRPAARSESLLRAADHLLSVARAHSLTLDQVVTVLRRRAHAVHISEKKSHV
ncbi:MAG: GntR family transcriptional regulator [bacterium]|nr:GntR family transcriptional regulator [bacterium]